MQEKETMATKRCSKCGKVLPISEFGPDKKTKDGYNNQCKECVREYQRGWLKKKRDAVKAEESKYSPEAILDGKFTQFHKVFSNPDLAKFSPRDLILELRARGYSGELSYTMKVQI